MVKIFTKHLLHIREKTMPAGFLYGFLSVFVCGQPNLSFGVWELRPIAGTVLPNYRRELKEGSGSPPTVPRSTSPSNSSRINKLRLIGGINRGNCAAAMLLQVQG